MEVNSSAIGQQNKDPDGTLGCFFSKLHAYPTQKKNKKNWLLPIGNVEAFVTQLLPLVQDPSIAAD